MAHGAGRYNLCTHCKQYIFVSRFSEDPICPNCNTILEQTTIDKIISKYNLNIFWKPVIYSTNWVKIK